MKVLLVEDNHADARLFAELLSEVSTKSFQLTTTDTFASAAPLVRDHDIVFLDLSLPDAFGIDTVARMVQLADDLPVGGAEVSVDLQPAGPALLLPP